MKLHFENAKFKNILSFGNKFTKINFNAGLNLITGNNGSGKSSALLDTLSFCLFGQPYRKINIEDLVNRKNKKNLEVTYTFWINNDKFSITRGLKPKKLIIIKNDIPINILSTKGLVQNEIDKIIGINYKLFKQIISLSINYNEPFLKLSIPKKREIIEQIFSIDVFAEMSKIIKTEIKDLKIKIDTSKNVNDILKQSISFNDNNIKQLEKTENTFEQNKKKEIDNINLEITNYKNKILELKENGRILLTQNIDIIDNREELENQKSKIISEIAEYNVKLKSIEDNINFLNKYDTCPNCNNKISKEYKQINIKNNNNIKIEYKTLIKSHNETLLKIKNDIDDIEHKIYRQEIKKNNIKTLKEKIINLNSLLKNCNNRKKIIQDRKFEFDINKAKEDIENEKLKYNNNKIKIKQDEKDLNYRKIIIETLSDTGIKSFIFKEMIPILNHNINEYLTLFELPMFIEFDKYMKETIKIINNKSDNTSYYCFSEGEKRRIDMSILLSFISIKKSLSMWNCNLLIIDELFDSSIDEIGLQKIIDSLNNMINNKNKLGIYIISHRIKKEYFSQFEFLMEINKKLNGFSEIKYLKKY